MIFPKFMCEQLTLVPFSEELLRQVSVDAAAAKLSSHLEATAGAAEYPLDIGEDYTQEQGR